MIPLLAASVAIVRREEVLLVQRQRAPSEGLWTLPGGRLEPGETTEQGAVREIGEELGLAVSGLKPLIVLRFGRFHLQTFATADYAGTVAPAPAEIRDWRWARPEQLAGLATTPRLDEVVAAALRLFARR